MDEAFECAGTDNQITYKNTKQMTVTFYRNELYTASS